MAGLELRVLPVPQTLSPSSPEPRSASGSDDIGASPCFFSQVCLRRSAIEKGGRSVCRGCAQRMRGLEYPLRDPSLQPLYLTGRSICEELDMVED
jgi:hypothetical protein